MNIFLAIILIGISLSMDAFSLALIYGTYSLDRKDKYILSIIVGIFHFFMPLMGLGVGSLINFYFLLNINMIVGVIFSIIGIEMIVSSVKDEEVNIVFGLFGNLLFGLSVSIDSFTTGIGLSLISNNYLLCSLMFMIISSFFTFMGLNLGNKLSDKFGKIATIIGGGIMIILGITYIF